MLGRIENPEKSVWKLPVLSGVILAFAYFPFNLFVPNFVAFLPMLHWLDANPRVSGATRLRACLWFGLTVHLLILHWAYAMLEISWLAIAFYLGLASVFALGVMVSTALAGWIRSRTGWSFALLLPACWLPAEWLRTWGDLRMTADHMAHTMAAYPFVVQFADVLGPYGVGAFMLLANALLYEAIRGWRGRRGRRAAVALGAVWAVVLAYGAWAWTHPPRASDTVRVAVIQPNIPLAVKHDPGKDAEQWGTLIRLTRQAGESRPDLIVWPESARPAPVVHDLTRPDSYAMPEVQGLALETGASILVGVEYARVRDRDRRDYDHYNAALLVHPDGSLDPVWTAKVYLVPFTEGIPFEPVLGWLLRGGKGEMQWLAGGFDPGPRSTPLPFRGGEVGVLVCYEELYFDLARELRNAGARLQVIVTNDAWFGRTVFQAYQANSVRLRAIENRSSFVRAANTGISGFVDPLGRYHEWTELFVEAMVVHDLPVTDVRTVYNRIGNVVAWLAIATLLVLVLIAWWKGKS